VLTCETTQEALNHLSAIYESLSPQLRRAADYVLDNPNEVGLNSMRQVAQAAEVKPNTLVRMAKAAGFPGYQAFRAPFRDDLRRGMETFPDRARWLQSIAQGGSHGQLFSQMAAASLTNLEQLEVKAAADLIVGARTAYVLGVGVGHALAHSFWYVARMALDNLVHVPRPGNLPIDDLARIGRRDVLLAMTFNPYRREVVDAVRLAKRRGASVVAISDSRSAPIAIVADHVFVVPTTTPQFRRPCLRRTDHDAPVLHLIGGGDGAARDTDRVHGGGRQARRRRQHRGLSS
jgi:DNA-binding MurR/RpiR family transcriptional regulator